MFSSEVGLLQSSLKPGGPLGHSAVFRIFCDGGNEGKSGQEPQVCLSVCLTNKVLYPHPGVRAGSVAYPPLSNPLKTTLQPSTRYET